MKIKHILSAAVAGAVALASMVLPASAEESYIAAITFQTGSYIYRDTFAQQSILKWDNELNEPVEVEGATFVDATITSDGTYTVELNGVEDPGGWNMLKVETNIDNDATPVTLTVTDVQMNGASVSFDAEKAKSDVYAAAPGGNDDYAFSTIANAARFQLINTYDNLSAIPNEGASSVKVTFEVSGLSSNAAEAPATDSQTSGESAPTVTSPSANKGSPETGVEGIAVVAGAAIAAGGVLLLSKKRK